jgi:hypothetical protein
VSLVAPVSHKNARHICPSPRQCAAGLGGGRPTPKQSLGKVSGRNPRRIRHLSAWTRAPPLGRERRIKRGCPRSHAGLYEPLCEAAVLHRWHRGAAAQGAPPDSSPASCWRRSASRSSGRGRQFYPEVIEQPAPCVRTIVGALSEHCPIRPRFNSLPTSGKPQFPFTRRTNGARASSISSVTRTSIMAPARGPLASSSTTLMTLPRLRSAVSRAKATVVCPLNSRSMGR